MKALSPLKVLTLHRPWGAYVVNGDKPIENRSWVPPGAMLGQRFAIHAGKGWDPNGVRWLRSELGVDVDPSKHLEGVIGIVRLVGWCSADGRVIKSAHDVIAERLIGQKERAALFGPFGWILRDQIAFKEPVPCRGFQKLWNLPHRLLEQVLLAEAAVKWERRPRLTFPAAP